MTRSEKKAFILKGDLPDRVYYGNVAFKTVRALLSYLGCIGIALAVTYYLDGTAGIILTAALLCALVLSIVMTVIVMRSVRVEITADKNILVKGEKVLCRVKLFNTLPITAPVIEIQADCSPQLAMESSLLYKGALAGRAVNVLSIPMTARYSGAAKMTIDRVTLTDYLGIFSFRLNVPEEQLAFKLAVYPDIPDAAVQTDFLKTTNKFSSNDDEEEESDEVSLTSTGMPGYDHRQYYPGDPIKRINWKLSSKRDIYMIRLDEEIRGAGQMFFLDCPVTEPTPDILKVRDNVIEGALTMFMMLIREGREATFFYCKDGLWLAHEIHSQPDVFALQEILSDYSPCEAPTPVPSEITAAGKTPIVFSAAVRGAEGTLSDIISQCPEALVITAYSALIPSMSSDMWTISDEFEFRKAEH